MLSVGDEVTKTFVKQDSATVLKDRQQCFFYEVAEGIFVLRNNLRYTGDKCVNNGEIEGSCHSRRRLRTNQKKAAGKRLRFILQLLQKQGILYEDRCVFLLVFRLLVYVNQLTYLVQ